MPDHLHETPGKPILIPRLFVIPHRGETGRIKFMGKQSALGQVTVDDA